MLLLSTIFFSFALIFSPCIASCDDTVCELTQEQMRDCGCKKKDRKKTRTATEDGNDANEERCGICTPQPQSQPQDQSTETDQTKCGCGKPKKSTALDCGCGKPKKSPMLMCGICTPQPPEVEETKKVSPDAVLENIALTCYQAGNLAGAQTKKEQQQAACNLVGSIFQLAAQVVKKDDKQATAHSRSIKSITHQLLNNASQEHIRSQLLTNKPYLIVINSTKSSSERNELINQLMSNPEDCQAFVEELFTAVNEYLARHEITLEQALHQALTDLAQAETATDTRSTQVKKEFSVGNFEVHNTSGKLVEITLHIRHNAAQ